MAKRVASYQLTDRNWDEDDVEEEEEQEEGYQIASEEVLSKRAFKKAKRRVPTSQISEEGVRKNPFGAFAGFTGFSGFSSTTTSSTIPSITKASEIKPLSAISFPTINPNFNSVSNANNKDFWKQAGTPVFTGNLKTSTPTPEASTEHKSENKTPKDSDMERDLKYTEQITGLNISVLNWIKEHIDKNPLIDLTPVFRDYEKYMHEIEEKYGQGTTGNLTKNNETPTSSKQNPDQQKTPGNNVAEVSPLTSKEISKPSFMSSTPLLQNQLQSTNGQKAGLTVQAPGFFSGSAKLAPIVSTETNSNGNMEMKKGEEEDDTEEHEKHERKTIEEKDAFYTIRCKLFFKKGQQWQELGVGMLYLKPLDGKTQLLVRMETTVGKVLLNICLSSSMPVSRTGKNNIILATVPNPPVFLKPAEGDNSKPVTYLIRVKGTIEADDLYKKLSESKEKA